MTEPSTVGHVRKRQKTGGRVKGTPNKATATIKEAITSVYADLQATAGKEHGHFLAWAKDAPTEFYRLAAKLIPVQVGGDPDNPVVHEIRRRIVDPQHRDG